MNDPIARTQSEPAAVAALPAPRNGFIHFWRRHDEWSVTIILMLLSICAWPDVWLHRDAMAPTDLIYVYPPWSTHTPPDIIPGTNPVLSDLVDMFYPQMEYTRKCLLNGDIPYWCDKIQNGTPFLMVIKHELMTLPLLVLILLLKVPVGLTVFFIGRHLIAGLFFYKYVRIIGLDKWPGLCGTIVFCYCKYTIQDFILPMDFQLFLIPIVAYGIERIIRSGSLMWIWLIPLMNWMNILSGFPAGTAYCLYFLALYAGWRAMFQPGRRWKLLGLFALLNIIPFLAAAPALVATADFFSGFDWSYRASYWSWRMPITSLLTWFFPLIYGPPYARGTPIGWWYEYSVYFGVLPALLFLQGLLFWRYDNIKVFFLLFTAWLIAILYNVGNILEHVVRHLPVFSSNPNTRQKMLLVFTLSVLVVYALSELARVSAKLRKFSAVLAAPAAVAAAWFAWKYAAPFDASGFIRRAFWLQAGVLLASLAVFLILGVRMKRSGWLKCLAVLLLFVDLQLWDKCWYPISYNERNLTRANGQPVTENRIAVGWNPTIRREAFFPRIPAMDFVSANIGEHKMLGLNTACFANLPLFYGINNFSGRGFFDARQKGLYRLVNEDSFTGGHNTQFLFDSGLRTRLASPVVDALSIKYIALENRLQIDDLQRDYVIRQPEWNSQIAIAPGESLVQTFISPRGGKLNRCAVHVAQGLWTSDSPATLKLKDRTDGHEQSWPEAQWHPAIRRLEFHLGRYELVAGHEYELTLSTKPDADGPVDVLCTKDVDILRTGTIEKDGKVWNGDLNFSLYTDRGNDYAFHQPEWNDTARLDSGDWIAQTFRSPRKLVVNRCDIRVEKNELSDARGCRLSIVDTASGGAREWTEPTWNTDRGMLEYSLGEYTLDPQQEIEIRLAVDEGNTGQLSVYCTKDVDVLVNGHLTVKEEPQSGDLTASLYAASTHDISKLKLVYDNEMVVLENTKVLGRAWLAGGLKYGSPDEVLAALAAQTGDLREGIWAEEDMRAIAGEPRPAGVVNGKVEAIELKSSYQRFSAETDRDCFLVVSDNYDHGWRAFVGGVETGVFRADYNLRAIALPKGQHTIEFRYRPPYFAASVGIALLAVVGHTAFLIGLSRRRSKRQAEAESKERRV